MGTVERIAAGAVVAALVLGAGTFGAPAALADGEAKKADTGAAKKGQAADVMDAAGVVAAEHKAFAELVEIAGIRDTLKGPGPLAVFAPTDAAVAALPKDKLEALKKDPAALKAVLLNHIAPVNIGPKSLATAGAIKTLGTMELTAKEGADKATMINDAKVITRLRASNGRVYPIDKVILPPAK